MLTRSLRVCLLLAMLVTLVVVPTSFSLAQDDNTILAIAKGSENYTTLATAISAADPSVAEALSGEGPYTVFAPTNAAFERALQEMGLTPVDIVSQPEVLTSILLYHVIAGSVSAEDVMGMDGEEVETLNGETVTIAVDGDTVTINGIPVIEPDMEASNGVIHGIDGVLIPESVMTALMGEEAEMAVPVDETLGQEDNPIVILFIPSENADETMAGAEDLAALLAEKTGLFFEPRVSTDYAAAIEAMCSGEAEIGALNTFGYILAHQRGCATVGVVSTRFGSNYYAGQIITLAGSGIETYTDLAGKTFCRPDPLSTSGWIIPSIALQANGVDLDSIEIVDAGGHDAVVTAVYNGECDAGATFEDARSQVEEEYPDVMDKVVVIDVSAPIPNDTLSFASNVSPETQAAIVDALLEIAGDEESLPILDAVYNWSGLEKAEDAFFDDFREQLDAAGIDIEDLQ